VLRISLRLALLAVVPTPYLRNYTPPPVSERDPPTHTPCLGGGRVARASAPHHSPPCHHCRGAHTLQPREREFYIDNLPVRIHFSIVTIRWSGLAPWEFEFPFPSSLASTFLVIYFEPYPSGAGATRARASAAHLSPPCHPCRGAPIPQISLSVAHTLSLSFSLVLAPLSLYLSLTHSLSRQCCASLSALRSLS